MNTVKVVADANGNIINVYENNPELGSIRVEQEVLQVGNGGWMKFVKRSAFIKGSINDLKKLSYTKGQTIPGKIVIKESLTPFNPKNPDKNLKVAGQTGIIMRVDDQPIYRDAVYTLNDNEVDELIQHDADCSMEIREAQLAQRELSLINPVVHQLDDVEL